MAYTILNTDGTTLLTLADKRIDQTTTSLTLVGKNYAGYGEYLNNNFIKLLANSASSTANPPRNPLKGQLWYDTRSSQLKVWTGVQWKPVGGAIVSENNPSTGTQYSNTIADIWFHPSKKQLSIVVDGTANLIGPAYPNSIGKHGWTLFELNGEPVKVKDTDDTEQELSVLHNYGKVRGYIANEKFNISTSPIYSSIVSTATTATVKGLTIFGDINYTGKTVDRYLTMTVDLDMFSTVTNNISVISHFEAQTAAIIDLLRDVFPVNYGTSETTSTGSDNISTETGVIVGSEAKVICKFTYASDNARPAGHQVRRFKAIGGPGGWDMVYLNTGTLTNVVSTIYRT
jgi:hypothetical protein